MLMYTTTTLEQQIILNPRCNLVIKQNSFFPKISSLYNELHISVKSLNNIHSFKKQCKANLLLSQASESATVQ